MDVTRASVLPALAFSLCCHRWNYKLHSYNFRRRETQLNWRCARKDTPNKLGNLVWCRRLKRMPQARVCSVDVSLVFLLWNGGRACLAVWRLPRTSCTTHIACMHRCHLSYSSTLSRFSFKCSRLAGIVNIDYESGHSAATRRKITNDDCST